MGRAVYKIALINSIDYRGKTAVTAVMGTISVAAVMGTKHAYTYTLEALGEVIGSKVYLPNFCSSEVLASFHGPVCFYAG